MSEDLKITKLEFSDFIKRHELLNLMLIENQRRKNDFYLTLKEFDKIIKWKLDTHMKGQRKKERNTTTIKLLKISHNLC